MKNIRKKISTVFFKSVALSCVLLPIIDPSWANALAYSYYSTNTNTAIGSSALVNNTGNSNIALDYQAGYYLTTGSNNIDIGNVGVTGESDTIRIGKSTTPTTDIATLQSTVAAQAATITALQVQLAAQAADIAALKAKAGI